MSAIFEDDDPPRPMIDMDGHYGIDTITASADVLALSRSIIARDEEAIAAVLFNADPTRLLVAACWLLIGALGTDEALADLQRQHLELLARHPEES